MFNLRVYGILINAQGQILVSDEYIQGAYYTKFPGGGLEIGEGTRDGLKREFMEEMNLRVDVQDHFYTTDFFQPSAFRKGDQIISVYYFVQPLEPFRVPIRVKPFDFSIEQLALYDQTRQVETFRFISREEFTEDCMSLPIDKVVAKMLLTHWPRGKET